MPDRVRCQDCGLLGIQDRDTRQIVEVEMGIRHKDEFPVEYIGGSSPFSNTRDIYVARPFCFAGEAEFLTDANYQAPPVGSEREFIKVIQKERSCQSFTRHKLGFSPKEHAEMVDRQQLLEWQKNRDEHDQVWREKQEVANRRWRIAEIVLIGVMIPLSAAVLQRDDVIQFGRKGADPQPARPAAPAQEEKAAKPQNSDAP